MTAPHSKSTLASSAGHPEDLPDLPFAPTLRKIITIGVIGFTVPTVIILLIALYIAGGVEPEAGSEALAPAAVSARVAPVGSAAVAPAGATANASASSAAPAQIAAAAPEPGPASAAAPAAAAATTVASAKPDGEALYKSTCVACHGAGVAGAPKVGDKAAWAPIIAQGMDTLYERAIHGYTGKHGVMPPKGGSTAPDDQVKAAVDYMVAQSK